MRSFPRTLTTLGTVVATTLAGGVASVALATPAQADRVTPGNFTGYGFDQCVAPTTRTMNAWMEHSPYSAVGIYISGRSRGCRNQPNLSKAWVNHQIRKGWRLLPITLGPQASCSTHFPRYGDDPVIRDNPRNNYGKARKMGRNQATKAVRAAKRLGIAPRSTLWYDIEAFDIGQTRCRESALMFLQAWTNRLHRLNYVSGVYSSVGSGIKILDNARMNRPRYTLPDRIWLARWDGKANLTSSYISNEGWMPHSRVKQYRGGHPERWGGVTINIDNNYMSLGRGSTFRPLNKHCGGKVNIDLKRYRRLTRAAAPKRQVRALQCVLRERGYYKGRLHGRFNKRTIAAGNAFKKDVGLKTTQTFNRKAWVVLLARGHSSTVKFGSTGAKVSRMQRAVTAATNRWIPTTGVFDRRTRKITRIWLRNVNLPTRAIVMNTKGWRKLKKGRA